MNSEYAKESLANRLKLTHVSFMRSEWVKGVSNNTYRFNDGTEVHKDRFWETRGGKGFNKGWNILLT